MSAGCDERVDDGKEKESTEGNERIQDISVHPEDCAEVRNSIDARRENES